MSHITHQSERDENAEMNKCMSRTRQVWVPGHYDDEGEYIDGYWDTERSSPCQFETINFAKDRCKSCGKTYTY